MVTSTKGKGQKREIEKEMCKADVIILNGRVRKGNISAKAVGGEETNHANSGARISGTRPRGTSGLSIELRRPE